MRSSLTLLVLLFVSTSITGLATETSPEILRSTETSDTIQSTTTIDPYENSSVPYKKIKEIKPSFTAAIGFILSCIAGITLVTITVLFKKKK
jgi:hypothetical protein